jgi:folate-binding protein YgfZ
MKCAWFHLADAVVLRVSGKDARRYLNNRLSNDLRSCTPGDVIRAAALSPQGRVEGLFSVVVEAEESFLLVCDGGRRNSILAALSRYIVADRVSVQDISLQIVVLHSTSVEPVKLEGGVVHTIPHARVWAHGYDYVLEGVEREPILEQCAADWGVPMTHEEYALLRWKQGLPAYPGEINEDTILTEAGMREAVSFTKGCYVGQEVIERSDAVGKLPRTLERIRFEGTHADLVRTPVVSASGQNIGKIVSCVSDTVHAFTGAFALLRNGAYASGDTVRCAEITGSILSKDEVVL